ncbi:succinate dehydrogenase assembly factor 2 [Pontivivens ytuae]|uniref:FAD assembly factor SdhE n=1 Tax=Pontivivens ytuae TaxID=2789856 RepID=A0A7S9QD18_9RHOB|nr:succinate dehydrogenase assembly factor 2 [Pontivivens ytuae]QPH53917.1 succinate dehydrogenase assembly factor 2 [Pontivivens ytuae]
MSEDRETRLKRLRMRSWRRGTKEMDIILGTYSDHVIARLDETELDAYEALLGENDNDLYAWFSGRVPAPEAHALTIQRILESRT